MYTHLSPMAMLWYSLNWYRWNGRHGVGFFSHIPGVPHVMTWPTYGFTLTWDLAKEDGAVHSSSNCSWGSCTCRYNLHAVLIIPYRMHSTDTLPHRNRRWGLGLVIILSALQTACYTWQMGTPSAVVHWIPEHKQNKNGASLRYRTALLMAKVRADSQHPSYLYRVNS